jgi:hypothetical protein
MISPELSPLTAAMASERHTRMRRRVLGLVHAAGGGLLLAVAAHAGGGAWMVWPAASLFVVAAAYGPPGVAVFGRSPGPVGPRRVLAVAALWPYLLTARVASWLRTRAEPMPCPVTDGVHVGPYPGRDRLRGMGIVGLVDMSAESWGLRAANPVVSIPCLEGITPDVDRLVEAVRAIEQASRAGPVLVSSAAGRARGAAGVAAWLYATGRARSIYDALQWVRRADPRVHLDAAELLSCLNRVRERYRSAPDA